jgi:hypothetical protein
MVRACAGLVAILLAWCAVPTPAALAETMPDWQALFDVLALTNQQRAAEGLTPLQMDTALIATATLRAGEAAQRFEHLRPDGTSCFTAFPADYAKPWGENLAYGQATPEAVVAAWMASQAHRENILGADYRSLGVGLVLVNGKRYWAQAFTAEAVDPMDQPTAGTTVASATPSPTAAVTPAVVKTVAGGVTVRLAKSRYVYAGKAIKPKVTVVAGAVTLKKGRDYTVTYKSNAAPGRASVVVKGKAKPLGRLVVKFTITPPAPRIKTALAAGAGRVKIAWSKAKGAVGYQAQASDGPTFGGGNSVVLASTLTSVLLEGNFEAGSTYYLRLRGYVTLGGKRVYGPWSAVKSFTATG